MPTLTDIFNNRPFRAVELTAAMTLFDVVPTLLGELGEDLFPTVRSRTRTVAIFKQDGVFRLVPTSSIGAPPVELEKQPGELRPFFTRRLAKASTVYAEEMQGVLTMPLLEAVQSMQEEIATRSTTILRDIELTEEHMRLGAVQGIVVDADGTTVLDNWFANWGAPNPTMWYFDFVDDAANIRETCYAIRDAMWYASRGSWIQGRTTIHALCGGAFFVGLTTHPQVEKTYLNYQAAAELRDEIEDTFSYGGIIFHRYRGTPNGDFSIPDDECRLFPVGTVDAFQRIMGPGEFGPFINQPGQDIYSMVIPDRDRDAWARFEAYNYPLYACQRPEMLASGSADAAPMGGAYGITAGGPIGHNGGPKFSSAQLTEMLAAAHALEAAKADPTADAGRAAATPRGERPTPGTVPATAGGARTGGKGSGGAGGRRGK